MLTRINLDFRLLTMATTTTTLIFNQYTYNYESFLVVGFTSNLPWESCG